MINRIQNKLTQLKDSITSKKGQIDLLSNQISQASTRLNHIEVDRDTSKKAVEVLDLVQGSIRKLIKDGFETVVTNALQTIYGDDFGFLLEFGRRGNLQEVDFKVINKTLNKSHDPKNVVAGGEIDVIALALRVVILELYQRVNKSPFIADESFKFVSSDYVIAAGNFLQVLNEKMGRQILMVTHKKELLEIADNVIDIEKIKEGGKDE